MPELKRIDGIEVFATGEWNGDLYTIDDLDAMVEAYNETKEHHQPFLKIGHDREQKLIKNSELPSAGTFENFRRVGEKLVADLVDLPQKVFAVMQSKSYKKRSAEIFFDIPFMGKTYSRMIKAIALLGADMPAVSTLDDIINFFELDAKAIFSNEKIEGQVIVKSYTDKKGKQEPKKEPKMPELDEAKVKEFNDKIAALEADKTALEGKLGDKEEKLKTIEKDFAQAQADKKAAEVKSYCEELKAEGLATPATSPMIEAIFSPDQKEYSIETTIKKEGGDEKVEKKYSSKQDLLKEVLKLHSEAAKVNLEESSLDSEGENNKNSEDALLAKAKKYAKENDCSFREAYVEVTRQVESEE